MIHGFHFEAMDMLHTCLAGNCMTSGTQNYNFYFLKVKHLHKIKSILCKNCLVRVFKWGKCAEGVVNWILDRSLLCLFSPFQTQLHFNMQ